MKDFLSCSGPWVGQSVQEGFRLSEKIELLISKATFHGSGTDIDGDFNITGTFDQATGLVTMVRRYTRSPKNPSQVGYAFDYLGKWNGYYVSGAWMFSTDPTNGGPFEMWPEEQEEMTELNYELTELTNTH